MVEQTWFCTFVIDVSMTTATLDLTVIRVSPCVDFCFSVAFSFFLCMSKCAIVNSRSDVSVSCRVFSCACI